MATLDPSEFRNPFDYANPVRTDEYFAGRGHELFTIDYTLEQASTSSPVKYLALYGQRAAGKTSLLNMTEKLAVERGYLVVRVSLVPTSAEPAHFFSTVYEELIAEIAKSTDFASSDGKRINPRRVRRIVEGGPVDDEFPLEFPENLAHAVRGGQLSEMALRNDMSLISEISGRPIVLLIDEAQIIADRPDVLSLLRTLSMRLNGYVLVLAGTPELVTRINEVFDFLLRQFEFIKVERFVENADVIECMARPLKALNLAPSRCFTHSIEAVASDLIPLTDGNPYEIQLFCHIMFTRWQTGATDGMDLTAEAIDGVRATLDVGNQHADRKLVSSTRGMSDEELLALNVWASSLEQSTVDEIRFASQVSGLITLTIDQLNHYLDQFIRDGLVEIVNNKVRLIGDAAEQIYVRLSTVQRLGSRAPVLLRRINFKILLAGELVDLLRDQILMGIRWLLRTCCPSMLQEKLDSGIRDLTELPSERDANYTVEYLHEAILECGVPNSLQLTTVECSYGETRAIQWICRRSSDDFDVEKHPEYIAAKRRITSLGGTLNAIVTTIPVKPIGEIMTWLVKNFNEPKARLHMAHRHSSAAVNSYSSGDLEDAFRHLHSAFQLSPDWQVANNLAYMNLSTRNYQVAQDWAQRAIQLSETTKERALSRYNGGVAAALLHDMIESKELLANAAHDLDNRSPLEDDDWDTPFLIVLSFNGKEVDAEEVRDADLTESVARAFEIADLAARLDRLDS